MPETDPVWAVALGARPSTATSSRGSAHAGVCRGAHVGQKLQGQMVQQDKLSQQGVPQLSAALCSKPQEVSQHHSVPQRPESSCQLCTPQWSSLRC